MSIEDRSRTTGPQPLPQEVQELDVSWAETWLRSKNLHRLIRDHIPAADLVSGWDFPALVHELREILHADFVALWMLNGNDLRLSCCDPMELAALALDPENESLRTQARISQEPQRTVETVDGVAKSRSRLVLPIKARGRFSGILDLSRNGGLLGFSQADEESLQIFADRLGSELVGWLDWQFLNAITETNTEAIAITQQTRHPDGNYIPTIVMTNPGMQKLLGYSAEEFLGRDAREMYPPGAYEALQRILKAAVTDVRRTGLGTSGPHNSTLRKKDGSLVPVSISFRLCETGHLQPPLRFTIAVAHDQTKSERLASRHERFLELLNAMNIAYFKVDEHGMTIESSAAELRLTGYSLEELATRHRKGLYAEPAERQVVLKAARQSPGQIKRFLLRLRRKDNKVFYAEGDLRIARAPEGFEFVEGFYRDVSDRVQLQGFLNSETDRVLSENELYEALKKDSKDQMDYLASIGHQIRTPLSSVIGTLENLQLGAEPWEEIRSRLPYVIAQVRACTQLVKNLSYMDRILGGGDIQRSVVSLAKLAIETKLDVDALLEAKGLRLKIDDREMDRLLVVHGDSNLLRQVLVNLIDNAIKYSLPRKLD